MDRQRNAGRILKAATAGAELSWLFAWANYLTLASINHSYSVINALAAFGVAALLTAWQRGRGWRVVSIIGWQAFGFILASLYGIYHFHGTHIGFFNYHWLYDFVLRPQPAAVWLAVSFEVILVTFFWISGVTWVRRKHDYQKVCARFDLGLSAFFVLFIVKFTVRARFDVIILDQAASTLMIAFFCFGFLSLALARTQGVAVKSFRAGYHGLGTVMVFAAVILILGVGATAFCLPALTAAADTGYEVMKTAARPVGQILIVILRFLFGPRKTLVETAGGKPDDSMWEIVPSGPSPWWMDLAAQIIQWGAIVLFALAGLAVAGFLAYRLWVWLISRTERKESPSDWWGPWLRFLDGLFRRLIQYVRRVLTRRTDSVSFYLRLLQWGRRSGLPRHLAETPREYGRRLGRAFPKIKKEIETLIQALEISVYAGQALEAKTLADLRRSWRRLVRPDLWFLRLKVWFISPHNQSA
ncbi:MAG: DUF4129 domain-containing protein [Pseudomonadota bacterium]